MQSDSASASLSAQTSMLWSHPWRWMAGLTVILALPMWALLWRNAVESLLLQQFLSNESGANQQLILFDLLLLAGLSIYPLLTAALLCLNWRTTGGDIARTKAVVGSLVLGCVAAITIGFLPLNATWSVMLIAVLLSLAIATELAPG